MGSTGRTLRRDIARGLALRKYSDAEFAKKTAGWVAWRTNAMRDSYADLLQDARVASVLNYYFNEVFSGVDLTEFSGADRTIAVAEKLFTGTDMLRSALEFNALAGEIEEKLTAMLFEEMQVDTPDETVFIEAAQCAGVIDDMRRQIDCFRLFADDLNTTVSDKRIAAAIKLARVPARIGGFPKIHRLVANGFAAMGKVRNPERVAVAIEARELTMIDRLAARKTPLYA